MGFHAVHYTEINNKKDQGPKEAKRRKKIQGEC